jgi:hypothetical protein
MSAPTRSGSSSPSDLKPPYLVPDVTETLEAAFAAASKPWLRRTKAEKHLARPASNRCCMRNRQYGGHAATLPHRLTRNGN